MPSDKFKNTTDGEFSELDYATRAGFWYAAKWVGACLLAGVVVVVALWATGLLFASPKGAGDAYKTNQSGSNRISKQEMFEQMYADIQSADQNIGVLHDAMLSDPSYVSKTNYTAAKLACNQLVTSYNAEARKYTSQQWRSNDLPSSIDQTNPKFDCKEATK